MQFTVDDQFSFSVSGDESEPEPGRLSVGNKNWKHLIRFKEEKTKVPIYADPIVKSRNTVVPVRNITVVPPKPAKAELPTPVAPPVQIATAKKSKINTVEEHTADDPIEAKPVIIPDPRPRSLDILFVIDTSSSMDENLMFFKKKFSGFLSPLKSMDWRWGFTNADSGDSILLLDLGAAEGRLINLERDGIELFNRTYLDAGVQDYDRIFIDTVSKHGEFEYYSEWSEALEDEFIDQCDLPPYCQGYQEQPLKSLNLALTKNYDFFRSTADLAVVIMTNSEERANDPENAVKPEEVIKTFHRVHGSDKKFKVYSIIIPAGDEACIKENKDSQWFVPEGAHSQKAADLAHKTGGKVFNICAPHYEEVARSIYSDFQ